MFWIKVDAHEKGDVVVTTYNGTENGTVYTASPIRSRSATTVSQALRKLAAAIVTAKAEQLLVPRNSENLKCAK